MDFLELLTTHTNIRAKNIDENFWFSIPYGDYVKQDISITFSFQNTFKTYLFKIIHFTKTHAWKSVDAYHNNCLP